MKKKVLKRVILGVFIFLVIAVISGILIFKFCFGGDRLIENVKNFDRESAREILAIMQEAEKEAESSEDGESEASGDDEQAGEDESGEQNQEQSDSKATSKPQKSNDKKPSGEQGKSTKKAEGATAEARIRSVASADEIADGMAILAKVDMGKVNSLRSSGKTKELKKYITSVLSGAEIRRALQLYSKYAHLL